MFSSLKNVADTMPLFTAENRNRGPGGRDLRTPYIPAVRLHAAASMMVSFISSRMATFEDGLACYEYALGYRLWG